MANVLFRVDEVYYKVFKKKKTNKQTNKQTKHVDQVYKVYNARLVNNYTWIKFLNKNTKVVHVHTGTSL